MTFANREDLMKKHTVISTGLVLLLSLAAVPTPALATSHTSTPQALVETYDGLADTILSAKKTEWNLVHAILAMTYLHAEGVLAQAKGKLGAGQSASGEIETLAELVAQLGNEGDASVAAIRKRLIEGGHHHNAAGERQGLYDEGFVIVTREAKKAFIASATSIAKLAASGNAKALDAEWSKVEKTFKSLYDSAAH